jgi:hypothetical protein
MVPAVAISSIEDADKVKFTNFNGGNSDFNPGYYTLSSASRLHKAGSDGRDVATDIETLLKTISGVRQ